jgi:membrane-bound lytic murein transglycosylase MltF
MRVIQDSDDEFEDDLEHEGQVPQAGNASAAPQEQVEDASSKAGTGSTGMLQLTKSSNRSLRVC